METHGGLAGLTQPTARGEVSPADSGKLPVRRVQNRRSLCLNDRNDDEDDHTEEEEEDELHVPSLFAGTPRPQSSPM